MSSFPDVCVCAPVCRSIVDDATGEWIVSHQFCAAGTCIAAFTLYAQ
jgi:hypothetical protein